MSHGIQNSSSLVGPPSVLGVIGNYTGDESAPVAVEEDEDMEEKEILAEAGRTDGNSKWKTKKREIEGRKSKWVERFASSLTPDDIAADVLTRAEIRIERMKETGWQPSQVRPEKIPPAPVTIKMDQIPKYKTLAAVTYLCYKCWRSVPVGVDRISCKLCNVVAHRKCIPDLSKYAVVTPSTAPQTASSKPATAITTADSVKPLSRHDTSLHERMKTHPDVILYNKVRTAIEESAQFTNTLFGTNMGSKLKSNEETGKKLVQGDYKSQKLTDISLNDIALNSKQQKSSMRKAQWKELAEFTEPAGGDSDNGGEGKEIAGEKEEEEEEFDEAQEQLNEVNEMMEQQMEIAARRTSPSANAGRTIITLEDMKKSMKSGVGTTIMSPMSLKRMNSLSRRNLNSADSTDSNGNGLAGADAAEAQTALDAMAAVQAGSKIAPRLNKSSRNMSSSRVLLDLNVCKIVWKCPFCVEEVVAYNKHYLNNYERTKHEDLILKSILKMQSFSRMVPVRVEFLTGKFGIIHAQRKFRSRLFWLKMAADTMNVPRPFRLKIHDILLVYRNSEAVIDVHPRDLASDKVQIGQMMASVYPAYSSYEAQGKDVPKNHKDILKLLMGDNFVDGSGVSSEVPAYSTTFNKAAIVSRNDLFLTVCIAESRPDGDMRQGKQYYRFDLPIRQSGKAVKLTPRRLEMLGCSNMKSMSKHDLDMIQENYKIIPYSLVRPYILLPSCARNSTVKITLSEVGEWPKSVCLGQAAEVINNYLMWKKIVSTRQGMIKCTWNDLPVADEMSKLDVRLQPKVRHVGSLPGLKPREKTKKAEKGNDADANTDSLSLDVDLDDDVSVDSQGSLSSVLSTRRRDVNPQDIKNVAAKHERVTQARGMSGHELLKSPTGRAAIAPSAMKARNGLRTPGGLKSPGSSQKAVASVESGTKEFVKEYVASSVTWSLLSVSYDGNDFAGYMYFLVMASVHSAKKKCWCIMIDGVMMTFSSVTDLKTKESIDLRYCHIAELAEGVIELIYVKEQPQKIWYYVLAPSNKERLAWLS